MAQVVFSMNNWYFYIRVPTTLLRPSVFTGTKAHPAHWIWPLCWIWRLAWVPMIASGPWLGWAPIALISKTFSGLSKPHSCSDSFAAVKCKWNVDAIFEDRLLSDSREQGKGTPFHLLDFSFFTFIFYQLQTTSVSSIMIISIWIMMRITFIGFFLHLHTKMSSTSAISHLLL